MRSPLRTHIQMHGVSQIHDTLHVLIHHWHLIYGCARVSMRSISLSRIRVRSHRATIPGSAPKKGCTTAPSASTALIHGTLLTSVRAFSMYFICGYIYSIHPIHCRPFHVCIHGLASKKAYINFLACNVWHMWAARDCAWICVCVTVLNIKKFSHQSRWLSAMILREIFSPF